MSTTTTKSDGITRITQPERDSWPLSPCVMICTLDENEVCYGCGRTLDEIGQWGLLGKDEQWAIIDRLEAKNREGD